MVILEIDPPYLGTLSMSPYRGCRRTTARRRCAPLAGTDTRPLVAHFLRDPLGGISVPVTKAAQVELKSGRV